jgi:hypothetical protein
VETRKVGQMEREAIRLLFVFNLQLYTFMDDNLILSRCYGKAST